MSLTQKRLNYWKNFNEKWRGDSSVKTIILIIISFVILFTTVTAKEDAVDYVQIYQKFLKEEVPAMQKAKPDLAFCDAYIIDGENDMMPELVVMFVSNMGDGYTSDVYKYTNSSIVKMEQEELSDYRYQNTGGQKLRNGCTILQDSNGKFYFMSYDHVVGNAIIYELYEKKNGRKSVIYKGTDLSKITTEYYIILKDVFMIGYEFTDSTKFKFGSELARYYKPTLLTEISVVIDDVKVEFDQPPIIENGRTLVPIRAIFEKLGAEVEWFEESQQILVTKGTMKFAMKIGVPEIYSENKRVEIDVSPKIINGRTLVPVRAIAETIGADVSWDNENSTVIIKSNSDKTSSETLNKIFSAFKFTNLDINGDRALSVSPSGKYLVTFHYDDVERKIKIYSMNFDAITLVSEFAQPKTISSLDGENISWSKSENKIIFSEPRAVLEARDSDVYYYDIETNVLKNLTDKGDSAAGNIKIGNVDYLPRWSEDEQDIYFARWGDESQLCKVNIYTKEVSVIKTFANRNIQIYPDLIVRGESLFYCLATTDLDGGIYQYKNGIETLLIKQKNKEKLPNIVDITDDGTKMIYTKEVASGETHLNTNKYGFCEKYYLYDIENKKGIDFYNPMKPLNISLHDTYLDNFAGVCFSEDDKKLFTIGLNDNVLMEFQIDGSLGNKLLKHPVDAGEEKVYFFAEPCIADNYNGTFVSLPNDRFVIWAKGGLKILTY